jgi:hypothetical protein
MVKLTQSMMQDRLTLLNETQCTVNTPFRCSAGDVLTHGVQQNSSGRKRLMQAQQ